MLVLSHVRKHIHYAKNTVNGVAVSSNGEVLKAGGFKDLSHATLID